MNAWVGYEPFFIAESDGFFNQNSIDLIETPYSLTQDQAFRGRTVDASAVSLSRAMSLASKGHDITIVLILDWSNGADKIVAAPNIKSVIDLKGKRVGTEPESVNAYLLFRAMQQVGLSLSDLEMMPMAYEQLSAAFSTKEIDAATVFGPQAEAIEQLGGHVIFDSSEIPGEILDVLVVRTSYLQKNPERVEELISGWLKAVASLEENIEGPRRKDGLLSSRTFAELSSTLRITGETDNHSFMEAGAARLMAVLSTRHSQLAAIRAIREAKRTPFPDTIPAIDPLPFFRAMKEGE